MDLKNFPAIEHLFFLKSQYLAFYLKNPQYFSIPDEFDHAYLCDFPDAFK